MPVVNFGLFVLPVLISGALPMILAKHWVAALISVVCAYKNRCSSVLKDAITMEFIAEVSI